MSLMYEGADWNFDLLKIMLAECEQVATKELGLDLYPNRLEIVTAEQMLDAYASIGLPIYYRHWSFGKRLERDIKAYQKGHQSLAYEIVINSNPCISYLMEENTATMQLLVIAHAGCGHNSVYKNNYLFKQWTDASGIIDYMEYAKNYIASCEERYGYNEVEKILDAAHAIGHHGVFKFPAKKPPSLAEEERRAFQRKQLEDAEYNDLWRTLPKHGGSQILPPDAIEQKETDRKRAIMGLPQENFLYFLEKHSPILKTWQREVLRIVRNVEQYFYPQMQCKLIHEGVATFTHYEIINRLLDKGRISSAQYLEFIHSHTNVVFQPSYDDPRFSGFNPYALGFAMFQDIKRIVLNPTPEDVEWFPGIAGTKDYMAVIRQVIKNYRDESFVGQFLSPKVIRDLGLMHVSDKEADKFQLVRNIQDEQGYREIRRALARDYDISRRIPNLEIVQADMEGNRELVIEHKLLDEQKLHEGDTKKVMEHVAYLWGYDIKLIETRG